MKQLLKRIIGLTGYEFKKIGFKPKAPAFSEMISLLEALKKRGLNCKTIMDVGANKTEWSRMAKKIYAAANFVLIEPQIEMKENLDRFCQEFKGSTYFLAGAGAKKEELTLTVWDDLAGSSFLPAVDTTLKDSGKQRQIEIITIDGLIASSKIDPPELIKLDIQGFELEALKGAEKTFGYTEAYILEVSLFTFDGTPGMPILSDVVNFMLARDYVVYDFPGLSRRPSDGALGQCDICFVKRNGFLRSSNKW